MHTITDYIFNFITSITAVGDHPPIIVFAAIKVACLPKKKARSRKAR